MNKGEELNPDDWAPMRTVWSDFVQRYPEFGYTDSDHSYGRFARQHFTAMQRRGAMLRISSGRYLCHRARFAQAAFEALVQAAE